MAWFTVWVTTEHRKANTGVIEFAIPIDGDTAAAVRSRAGDAGCKEWVTAFGTEEVLFMVRPFAECFVVEGDEPLVNDRCFAVVAFRSKQLATSTVSSENGAGDKRDTPRGNPDDNMVSPHVRTKIRALVTLHTQSTGSMLDAISRRSRSQCAPRWRLCSLRMQGFLVARARPREVEVAFCLALEQHFCRYLSYHRQKC